MEEMETITMPSGAQLKIGLAPFKEAKALYQAVLAEGPGIKVESTDKVENAVKDLLCIMLSSARIETALKPCMERCLYGGKKIDDQSFEPKDARQDYVEACYLIAKANIEPFTKSLYARFSQVQDLLKSTPA